MSARLGSIERAVRPGDRRRGHDPKEVARQKIKSDAGPAWIDEEDQGDESVEKDEGAEELQEEVMGEADAEAQAAEASKEDEGQLSLPQLAEEIRQAHECCEQLQGRAMASAINAGKLLIEARKRVSRGKWLPWLKKVGVPERTAQRYIRLAKCEAKLDALDPSWRSTWWPTEALHALAEPTGLDAPLAEDLDEDDDGGDTADAPPSAETDDDDAEDEEEQANGATAAQERKEARAIYRRAVAYLPKLREAAKLTFEPRSAEQEALQRIERALVRVARSAARPFNTMVNDRNVPPEVQEVVVAMRLVERLFEKTQIEKLFRPA